MQLIMLRNFICIFFIVVHFLFFVAMQEEKTNQKRRNKQLFSTSSGVNEIGLIKNYKIYAPSDVFLFWAYAQSLALVKGTKVGRYNYRFKLFTPVPHSRIVPRTCCAKRNFSERKRLDEVQLNKRLSKAKT